MAYPFSGGYKKPSLGMSTQPSIGSGFGGQVARNTTGYRESQLGPTLPSGGGMDFGQQITNDPLYRLLQGQVNTDNTAAGAAASTGFGQLLGNFGEIPDFAQTAQQLGLNPGNPLYGLLMNAANNPNTQAAAKSLTDQGLSQVGGWNRQLHQDQNSVFDLMGQRGTLRSGATGVGLNLAQQDDRQRRFTGSQNLLSQLTGIANQYNTTQQQGVKTLQGGLLSAANRRIGLQGRVPSSVLSSLNIGGNF